MESLLYQFGVGGLLFFGGWAVIELSLRRLRQPGIPARWKLLLAGMFLFFLLGQGLLQWL